MNYPRIRLSLLTISFFLFPAWHAHAYDAATRAAIERVVQTAESYLGTPHRLGGTSRSGIDCSGLMYVSFREANQTLPRVSRDQARVGTPVRMQDLRRGDMVFFSQNGRVFHVGLVLESTGNDALFVHASSSRGVIRSRLSESYWQQHYTGARRIWPETHQEEAPSVVHTDPVGHISLLDTAGMRTFPGRFPQASQRLLTASELRSMSKKQLRLMRNEIFARHGYVFRSADLRRYFGKQKWYSRIPRIKDLQVVSQRLSVIERANVSLLSQLAKD